MMMLASSSPCVSMDRLMSRASALSSVIPLSRANPSAPYDSSPVSARLASVPSTATDVDSENPWVR